MSLKTLLTTGCPWSLFPLRPALAHRCSEGTEAAGEGLRGSAALPAKGRSIGGEANQGERLLHCPASLVKSKGQFCVTDFLTACSFSDGVQTPSYEVHL